MNNTPQQAVNQATARARRHLVPFLLLMYVVAFLDRANIGFAKQQFQLTAHVSEAAYALGAGLFFLSYALFEIPSNLILHRVGARLWMCRIMLTWGLVSVSMVFVHGPASFYIIRLLLGFAEAGFFPGVILYLTYWFPQHTRGPIMGQFYLGPPLAFIFGSPLSGILLMLHGPGSLLGWQWMFLVEGLVAVAIGIWAFWYLSDKPADAPWLSPQQQTALQHALDREERERHAHGPSALLAAFRDRRLLQFSAIYFLIQVSVYGVVFYLPAEVAAILGQKIGFEVSLVSAVPWLCALAAVIWIPRQAARMRRPSLLAAAVLAVAGLASAAILAPSGAVALVCLCIAAAGFIGMQPVFWTFPTDYLSGRAAAGGIAAINTAGALGGFLAPNIKVWADRHFGFPSAGLYTLALFTLLAALLLAFVRHHHPASSSSRPH